MDSSSATPSKRSSRPINRRGRGGPEATKVGQIPLGFDYNWVVNDYRGPRHLRSAAKVYHSGTGRYMEVLTTTPGIQLYSGNYLNNIKGKEGATYRQRHGLCLECQTYPDSINVDPTDPKLAEFAKGQCFILKPGGDDYYHKTIYSFGISS